MNITIRRALISVSDKSGLEELARALADMGVSILSTGGTARTLAQSGIAVTEVADVTGFPEMLDGRVKTLHPRIHGGLLARRDLPEHMRAIQAAGIEPIDLVVVNLYPFEKTVARPDCTLQEAIENIDIGGPSMLRAAAKNHHGVAVIVDPGDYAAIIAEMRAQQGALGAARRFELAKKVFTHTAAYDAAISNYLYRLDTLFPSTFTVQFDHGRTLRYGENPHQQAAVYGTTGIAGTEPIQGKQMSYNNYLDVNAGVALLREFEETAAVIVKHNNPCGVAIGTNLLDAYITAREVDPVSAYGSVVCLNREIDKKVAEEIAGTFVEVLVAPSFSKDALAIMAKKENMRVFAIPPKSESDEIRSIDGGVLVQRTPPYQEHWEVITDRDPTPDEMRAIQLAWKVCKHTKSNTIIFADQKRTLGIGAGQMSRVDSARIAVEKACASLKGSAVASDAFLPFPDTLEVAAQAGATALVQPGGSIRDKDVIDAANRLHMAMVFTGVRYFRH